MKLVAVGGHSRNIGKTSLMCSLIAGSAELGWTAVKISQYGHGVCSRNGKPCGCAVDNPEHPYSIEEESEEGERQDTRRMLAAGARRALWVRAPQGGLDQAIPELKRALGTDSYVMMESNTILDHLSPDFYVVALDFRIEDFKSSCRRHLERADAFAVVDGSTEPWEWFDCTLLSRKQRFGVSPPGYSNPDLTAAALAALRCPVSAERRPAEHARVTSR